MGIEANKRNLVVTQYYQKLLQQQLLFLELLKNSESHFVTKNILQQRFMQGQ